METQRPRVTILHDTPPQQVEKDRWIQYGPYDHDTTIVVTFGTVYVIPLYPNGDHATERAKDASINGVIVIPGEAACQITARTPLATFVVVTSNTSASRNRRARLA